MTGLSPTASRIVSTLANGDPRCPAGESETPKQDADACGRRTPHGGGVQMRPGARPVSVLHVNACARQRRGGGAHQGDLPRGVRPWESASAFATWARSTDARSAELAPWCIRRWQLGHSAAQFPGTSGPPSASGVTW